MTEIKQDSSKEKHNTRSYWTAVVIVALGAIGTYAIAYYRF